LVIFASFGVLVSFVITVTLIPAILLIRGPRPLKEFHPGHGDSTRIPGKNDVTRNKIAEFFTAVAGHHRGKEFGDLAPDNVVFSGDQSGTPVAGMELLQGPGPPDQEDRRDQG